MKKISLLALFLGFNIALGACSDDDSAPVVKNESFQLPAKAYVLAEQTRRAIVIRDAETQRNVWSWDPYTACVPSAHQDWFINPSEVKPVFNKRYILMTASGGAVALIRLSDHKLMFYANCGQNPHSAEILPDGNIVTAESKSGEINTFVVDTVKVFGFTQQPYGPKEPITRIALCPGSGKSVIGDALKAKAQVLITGDIDHHEGIDAAARGLAIIDAGHYGLT